MSNPNEATMDERLLLWFDRMKRQWFLGFFSYSEDRVGDFRWEALYKPEAKKLHGFNQMQWEMGGSNRADYIEFWSSDEDGILALAEATGKALGVELEMRDPLLADCEPPRETRGKPRSTAVQQ